MRHIRQHFLGGFDAQYICGVVKRAHIVHFAKSGHCRVVYNYAFDELVSAVDYPVPDGLYNVHVF